MQRAFVRSLEHRAEELRTLSVEMTCEEKRQDLLRLAQEYEEMAKRRKQKE